ncbi:hypothetical protein K2Q16_01810 [Patescibacteria group bacterium]|nr:hypothetical protein [Patescibacteria group bacterium]
MDFSDLLHFAYECVYFLIVFGVFIVIAIAKGRQALITIIAGLYLALLLSIQFPFYDQLLSYTSSATSVAMLKLGSFLAFTIFAVLLFARIMPSEFRETKFESFGKKLVLAVVATLLVMVYSFTILPVAEFLNPDTPLQSLFGQQDKFFWWLLTPLVILFFI